MQLAECLTFQATALSDQINLCSLLSLLPGKTYRSNDEAMDPIAKQLETLQTLQIVLGKIQT